MNSMSIRGRWNPVATPDPRQRWATVLDTNHGKRITAKRRRLNPRMHQVVNKLESVNNNKAGVSEGLQHTTIDPVVAETPNLSTNGDGRHSTLNREVRRSATLMEPPSKPCQQRMRRLLT